MKRTFSIALMLVLFVFSQSFALIGLRVGANANLVQPSATLALDQAMGEDPKFNPTGFGITGFAMANILFLNITADVGYINFGEQSFDYDVPLLDDDISASAKVTAVPIMIGLRKEFGLPVGPKFHVGAQVGVHNFTYTYEFDAADFENLEDEQTESKFSFAPIVGLRMGALDASLLYMVIEDFNYVGLRVGYTFGFGI